MSKTTKAARIRSHFGIKRIDGGTSHVLYAGQPSGYIVSRNDNEQPNHPERWSVRLNDEQVAAGATRGEVLECLAAIIAG